MINYLRISKGVLSLFTPSAPLAKLLSPIFLKLKDMLRLLRQPLLHFLVIGAVLFVINGNQSHPSSNASSLATDNQGPIVVDRAGLLDYMQYQAKAFATDVFNQRLDTMSEAERQTLIADYVREQALYREALRLKLEKGDYIIKQRLVQKVEFLIENTAADTINASEVELNSFYQQRLSDYKVDPVYSFTHIFFDAEQGGLDSARARAERLLPKLAGKKFTDASQFGDRFPFLQNYIERTRDFVINNFSASFVEALDSSAPSTTRWYGPFASRYGYHLVMLTQRTPETTPPLEQIRARVLDDFRYEALARKRQAAETAVIAGYDVQIKLEPKP